MGDFDGFFRTQAQPVWNYLRRLTGDAERSADLFQRVFLKAWTHFDRRDASTERAWIFTIAVNEARDEMRRRGRERVRPVDPADLRDRAADPGLPPEDRELVREVLRGLDELPPAQREIFLLVRYHGFTFAEAAGLAGIGLSAAKMAVARAHERLVRILAARLHLGTLL